MARGAKPLARVRATEFLRVSFQVRKELGFRLIDRTNRVSGFRIDNAPNTAIRCILQFREACGTV